MFRRLTVTRVIVIAAMLAMGAVSARADQVEDEYLRRSRALTNSDVRGHLDLAKWCKEKERWSLVADQCNLILRMEPGNAQAKLLRDIARSYLEKDQRGDRPPGADPGSPAGGGKLPRLLTDAEVQRIRRAELHVSGPERARVKVGRQAMLDFLDAMETAGNFPYGKKDFFRLSPIEKARLMLRYGGDAFAEKIEVATDPDRIRGFERDVTPIVAGGCASVECHGGGGPGKFQIYGGRRLRGNTLYTNFFFLHEYKVGEHSVIDRNNVRESLLLTYGLPPSPGDSKLNHPTTIRPVFADTDDRAYRAVHDWLATLTIERPDYGIDPKVAPAP